MFWCLAAKSRPALCDPMDWSLPVSSTHGTSQARLLEWVAISSSLPAKEETWFRSLGLEDPLEKDMAIHFGVLGNTEKTEKSHGQRSLEDYNPRGRKRVRHDLETKQQQVDK